MNRIELQGGVQFLYHFGYFKYVFKNIFLKFCFELHFSKKIAPPQYLSLQKVKKKSFVIKFSKKTMKKTISIGCDHAGIAFKTPIVAQLESLGWQVLDFGTNGTASVDYPDFAHPTAAAVESGAAQRGIVICGSGNGVAITANKHPSVRCALCWSPEIVQLARQHNDANMIAIPARFVTLETAFEMVETFLKTDFEGGRHQNRVKKIPCA
ncbi:MAG: ribose 5-phosphate isomerase [Bacteroidota bacterium]|jgi:ribose 5-phosphate isomerase B